MAEQHCNDMNTQKETQKLQYVFKCIQSNIQLPQISFQNGLWQQY